MSETLELLKLDHENAAHLLDLLEKQIEPGPDYDLTLLADIAAYFLDYPDLCHHPIEDAVFERIRKRDPKRARGLEVLLEEHHHIGEVTRSLARLIDEVKENPHHGPDRLHDEAAYFVKSYRAHMEAEERAFFPIAAAVLNDEDWASLDFDLFDRADPLFDPNAHDRFRALRQRIESESSAALRRAAAFRKMRELQSLRDLNTFNQTMREAHKPFRLSTRRSGGFALCADHDVLIDIPPCSETRATWCAWFYLNSQPHNAGVHAAR
jgi:hemerythrin-like domain-containing protein